MACSSPMVAGKVPGRTINGKDRYRFMGKATSWFGSAPVGAFLLPCRQCVCCRLTRSAVWAARLMHEIKSHDSASFLTLTYDDDHVPLDGSLDKSHLRSFFNDFRGRLSYNDLGKIKYFSCGEYGDLSGRPHYHAIVYGGHLHGEVCDYERSEEAPSRSGGIQWSHDLVSDCWAYGMHRISEVNFETAAYVARYTLKKVSGGDALAHYSGRIPEFQSSSNGLGRSWLQANKADCFPADSLMVERSESMVRMPVPDYYLRVLEKIDPKLFAWTKASRVLDLPTSLEWFKGVSDRDRIGSVKSYVKDQTLIRGGVL